MPKHTEIKFDPQNARSHPEANKKMVRQSLEEVGPFRSIAVDGDNIVRCGNTTLEQAEALGIKVKIIDAAPDELIAVRRKDLKGKKARRAALLDNRSSELAVWESGILSTIQRNEADLLAGLFKETEKLSTPAQNTPLDGPQAALGDVLLPKAASDTPESPEVFLARLVKKWGTVPGSIYTINSQSVPGGEHYLICGDCRTAPVIDIAGKVQGIFTSPPYAERRKKQYGGIAASKYVEWWGDVQKVARQVLTDNGSFFVNIKPDTEDNQRSLYVFDLVLAMCRQWGWNFIEEYCWLKHKMPGKDPSRFKNAFEPVYHFSVSQRPTIYHRNVATIGDAKIYRDTTDRLNVPQGFDFSIDGIPTEILPSNVVEAHHYDNGGIHPAVFPLALADFFVRAFSQPGERWYDPFSGSGTVLQAAEKAGRLSVGTDMMPAYIALSLEKFEELGCTVKSGK